MAALHFIIGKGGVGRSTFAAALAFHLAERNEGPILLLEIQGSGRSLQLCGLKGPKPYENTSLPDLHDAWGARLLPRETFKQYFNLLLALGNQQSPFAAMTASLRERVVDAVVENKIVSAFVDVCPGLEPAVLLGKVHWETTQGRAPESNRPWKHVIVDGPATGHGLMLFKSTDALREVFGGGLINKQASEIMSVMRSPDLTKFYVVTTPEELPVRETLDLQRGLQALRIPVHALVANRCLPASLEPQSGGAAFSAPGWEHEVEFEREAFVEQKDLLRELRAQTAPGVRFLELPEIFSDEPGSIARALSERIDE